MKKYILIILSFLIYPFCSVAETKYQKQLVNCTGIYYAYSMIPQGQLELDKIVRSIAAKKFLNSHLLKTGLNEDKLNKDLLAIVDELYGQPYNEDKVNKCDDFVYKTISNSKEEILKIVNSGVY